MSRNQYRQDKRAVQILLTDQQHETLMLLKAYHGYSNKKGVIVDLLNNELERVKEKKEAFLNR